MAPHPRPAAGRLAAALLVAFAAHAAVSAQTLEESAKRLEGKLMAPCCGANTLAEHYSGPAQAAKREIRLLLSQGKTEDEVLAAFVEQHGPTILASPPARGFNLVVYVVPLAVLLGLTPILWIRLSRWREATASSAASEPLPALDPADAERIRRALQDL